MPKGERGDPDTAVLTKARKGGFSLVHGNLDLGCIPTTPSLLGGLAVSRAAPNEVVHAEPALLLGRRQSL